MTRDDLAKTPPTNDQLREHFVGQLDNGLPYMAIWYPQMGGYGGKCWIVPGCWSGPHSKDGKHAGPPGFDAYVFHDGAFPFDPSDDETNLQQYSEAFVLHHCAAEQFIDFGRKCLAFLEPTVDIREESDDVQT